MKLELERDVCAVALIIFVLAFVWTLGESMFSLGRIVATAGLALFGILTFTLEGEVEERDFQALYDK